MFCFCKKIKIVVIIHFALIMHISLFLPNNSHCSTISGIINLKTNSIKSLSVIIHNLFIERDLVFNNMYNIFEPGYKEMSLEDSSSIQTNISKMIHIDLSEGIAKDDKYFLRFQLFLKGNYFFKFHDIINNNYYFSKAAILSLNRDNNKFVNQDGYVLIPEIRAMNKEEVFPWDIKFQSNNFIFKKNNNVYYGIRVFTVDSHMLNYNHGSYFTALVSQIRTNDFVIQDGYYEFSNVNFKRQIDRWENNIRCRRKIYKQFFHITKDKSYIIKFADLADEEWRKQLVRDAYKNFQMSSSKINKYAHSGDIGAEIKTREIFINVIKNYCK